jgi:hypothetical protein
MMVAKLSRIFAARKRPVSISGQRISHCRAWQSVRVVVHLDALSS